MGQGSVVGIATCYKMEGSGIESRWGARFSAPVQADPGVHLAPTGLFPRVKQPERGFYHPHTSSAEVKEREKQIPLLYFWTFVVCSSVNFTCIFMVCFLGIVI